jgi:hypothetical protein
MARLFCVIARTQVAGQGKLARHRRTATTEGRPRILRRRTVQDCICFNG